MVVTYSFLRNSLLVFLHSRVGHYVEKEREREMLSEDEGEKAEITKLEMGRCVSTGWLAPGC